MITIYESAKVSFGTTVTFAESFLGTLVVLNVLEKYGIMFVPTAVVVGKENTTILTGSTNVKDMLERGLSEG